MTSVKIIKISLAVLALLSATALMGYNILASGKEAPTSVTTPSNLGIKITRNSRLLQAAVVDGEARDWQYVGPRVASSCDATVFQTTDRRQIYPGNSVVLHPDDLNLYYCFRALNSDGEYGYQSYFVETPA